jgi:hypothetical protein
MFPVVAPAQVWTLANYVLTTARPRMFGFVSGSHGRLDHGGFVACTATQFARRAALGWPCAW